MIVAESPNDLTADNKHLRVSSTSPKKGQKIFMETFDEHGLKLVASIDERTTVSNSSGDLELDIAESSKGIELGLTKSEDQYATEYSSSFAETTSDACNGLSEAEVESSYFGDSRLGRAFDAFGNLLHLRRKKLTNHWRSFIRPLMWRCKWMELRIKDIESRAVKYSRDLEAYDQAKPPTTEAPIIEMYGSRSSPYSNPCHGTKASKRRKRKRVEDASDIASYLSTHNLFSYIETKKPTSDGIALADDFIVKDPNAESKNRLDDINDQSFFEHRDGDNYLVQILWKIELAHSQVHTLKTQIDLLVSKHTARYSSSENQSPLAACEGQTSPAFSAENGDAVSIGVMYNTAHNISEYDIGDLVLPDSAISSFGEAFHVPDIIESTMGLLSAADVTFQEPQIGDSCENILDSVLIHNEAMKTERHPFIRTNYQEPLEQIRGIGRREEEGESSRLSKDGDEKPIGPQEQPALGSSLTTKVYVSKNKRKRGERKAGSWCKKNSRDPDSQ